MKKAFCNLTCRLPDFRILQFFDLRKVSGRANFLLRSKILLKSNIIYPILPFSIKMMLRTLDSAWGQIILSKPVNCSENLLFFIHDRMWRGKSQSTGLKLELSSGARADQLPSLKPACTQEKRLEFLELQPPKNSTGGAVLSAPGTVEEEGRAKTYDVISSSYLCWKTQIAKPKRVAGY